MVEPVVDGACQIFGIAGDEEAASVQSKLRRSTHMAVGYHRNQARCKRFDAADRLALHVGGVYVQVGIQQVLYQFVASHIDKLRLVFKVFAQLDVFVILRSATRKNKLYPVSVVAVFDSIDNHILAFLL